MVGLQHGTSALPVFIGSPDLIAPLPCVSLEARSATAVFWESVFSSLTKSMTRERHYRKHPPCHSFPPAHYLPILFRYALKELIKDVNAQLALVQDETERARLAESTKFGIFVVHNKLKEKAAEIPAGVAYFAGMDIPDVWVDYPWEMVDILQHDELKRQDDAEAAAAKQ